MSSAQQKSAVNQHIADAMAQARLIRRQYAAAEQHYFETLYPVGSLIEFLEDGEWKGPAVVTKNRFGPVTAAHEPQIMVVVLGRNEELLVRHCEYVRRHDIGHGDDEVCEGVDLAGDGHTAAYVRKHLAKAAQQ